MQRTELAINQDVMLHQHRHGFSFGTDALLLSSFLRPQKTKTAVELGSGSGVISLLALQKDIYAKIYAVEIQADYAGLDGVLEQNAKANGLCNRLVPVHADLRTVNAQTVGGEVDAVFTNPPYLVAGAGKSSPSVQRDAARRELNGTIDDFCACADRLLKHGGAFYAVYRPNRLCDLLCAMRAHHVEPKRLVLVQKDTDHEPFAVLVEGKKGAKPHLKTDVLCLYDKAGNRTARYAVIQEKGVFTE